MTIQFAKEVLQVMYQETGGGTPEAADPLSAQTDGQAQNNDNQSTGGRDSGSVDGREGADGGGQGGARNGGQTGGSIPPSPEPVN
jgi:hypothetical protein